MSQPTNPQPAVSLAEIDALDKLRSLGSQDGEWESKLAWNGDKRIKFLIRGPGSDGDKLNRTHWLTDTADADTDLIAALYNAQPRLSATIRAQQAEIAGLKDKVEELDAETEDLRVAADKWHEEWERDCGRALRQLADECKMEWDEDGETADALCEHVSLTLRECAAIRNGADERDARMKREGAIEAIRFAEHALINSESGEIAYERLRQEAQRLKEGK